MIITIELPEELVARAKAVGVTLDVPKQEIVALVEAEVRKREAAQRMRMMAAQLQALPPELNPSADIEAEIRAHRAADPQ